MERREKLEKELEGIESYRYPRLAPPPEIVCDCAEDEGLAPGEHFHVRVMEAICDACNNNFTVYFHAYTKAEGYDLLTMEARGRGWSVDEEANYYLCPRCQKPDSAMPVD